mgnify:CR=1 FL=1
MPESPVAASVIRTLSSVRLDGKVSLDLQLLPNAPVQDVPTAAALRPSTPFAFHPLPLSFAPLGFAWLQQLSSKTVYFIPSPARHDAACAAVLPGTPNVVVARPADASFFIPFARLSEQEVIVFDADVHQEVLRVLQHINALGVLPDPPPTILLACHLSSQVMKKQGEGGGGKGGSGRRAVIC